MSAHTLTPWTVRRKVVQDGHGGWTVLYLVDSHGRIVMEKHTQGPSTDEDEANFRLAAIACNCHEDLMAAYVQVEGGFLDALHALNDAGLPCPASLGLAIEKLRVIIGKAKKPA